MRDESEIKIKSVIITGANSGIGKTAAVTFAKNGWQVIMACRNMTTSAAALQDIMDQSGSNHVSLMQLDISSFASIRRFNERIREHYDQIDCIIHNAAHFKHGNKKWQESADGVELTFATNTFGPFLMTHLLLDLLQKSDDPRILHACSTNIKHFFDPKRAIDWHLFSNSFENADPASRPYNSYKMYGDSKMALLMLTRKMAEEWKQHGIKVNALQISGVRISKETIAKIHGVWRVIARMQNLVFPPPDEMARNYFQLCASPDFKNVSGQLFNDKLGIIEPAAPHASIAKRMKYIAGSQHFPIYATDQTRSDQLWKLCHSVCLID